MMSYFSVAYIYSSDEERDYYYPEQDRPLPYTRPTLDVTSK